MRPIRALLAVALVAVALAGCSDDGDDSSADVPEETLEEQTTGTEGECEGTDLTFTNSTTGQTVQPDHTAAWSFDDGAVYAVYATDFEFDPADTPTGVAPDVPEGGNLLHVLVGWFQLGDDLSPLEVGTVVETEGETEPEEGVVTLTLIHDTADESFGNSMEEAGTLTVTAVGDTFCAEIDYSDTEKSLEGTIEAPVFNEP